MSLVLLKNVSPLGDLDVVGVGTVNAGAEFEVPESVAGRAPTPAKGEPDQEGYEPADPGEGLLAQPDNFVPAKKSRTSHESKSPDESAPADQPKE